MDIKSKLRRICILTSVLILFSGMLSCQKDRSEHSSNDIQPKEAQPVSEIADLMASMDMYHFPDPPGAPDFNLESVNGGRVGLAEYRGKVILLSFWATW